MVKRWIIGAILLVITLILVGIMIQKDLTEYYYIFPAITYFVGVFLMLTDKSIQEELDKDTKREITE